jgi:hypothetical protein
MDDLVVLRGISVPLDSTAGHAFVTDCTRAGEGLISDKELQEKYELSPVDWQNIIKDTALGHAIRAERDRRVLNGTAAREAACRHFTKVPTILDQIMSNEYASARHRIEAAKEIRQAPPAAATKAGRKARSSSSRLISARATSNATKGQ